MYSLPSTSQDCTGLFVTLKIPVELVEVVWLVGPAGKVGPTKLRVVLVGLIGLGLTWPTVSGVVLALFDVDGPGSPEGKDRFAACITEY